MFSNSTGANQSDASGGATKGLYQFNNNGFTVGDDWAAAINLNNDDMVSWTFRKAPKFFDVQTFTGDGTSNFSKKVSHNLGQRPGMVFVKNTSASSNWLVWYPLMDSSAYNLNLNNTNQSQSSNETNGRAYVESSGDYRLQVSATGTGVDANKSGDTYVAYFFAHNNSDGGFGPDQDGDIIKCGSYTGNGSATGPVIDLGFEPQWVLIKLASGDGENWILVDNMRGLPVGGNDSLFEANESAAESTTSEILDLTPTGFNIKSTSNGINTNNQTYIYMAIRRGPLAAPDDATKVFAIDTASGTSPSPPHYNSGFPVDMGFYKDKSSTDSTDWYLGSRLTQGKVLKPNSTAAEANDSALLFDFQNGFNNANWTSTNYIGWMWKRAPSYFDVSLTTQGSTSVPHALSVVPEMIWSKKRNGTDDWWVTMPTISGNQYGYLNKTDAFFGGTAYGTFSSTVFTTPIIGTYNAVNYLFATVAGVSKISSVVHSGTTNVDAGFSNGSRFVLLKRTDASGDWLIWDGTRGIVSANDPYLALNSTAAEVTNTDYIDPFSSGFTLTSNLTAGTYIYYAIA